VLAPVFFAAPAGLLHCLRVTPALASWDKAGSSGQLRSAAFIDDVADLVSADPATSASGSVAFRLDVGLPESVPLLALNDLDNYLFPLMPRVQERTGRRFTSVWATKRHEPDSYVSIGLAVPAHDPGGSRVFDVLTTASASTSAYKIEIRDQIGGTAPLSDGPVSLQLAFVVGPRRAWANLWKATIDSLGSILGHDEGAHEWNARDGRITELGLHCAVDESIGNKVKVAIRAESLV